MLASLLGLLPLIAVSRSIETGLALGVASLAVLCVSNVLAALLAGSIPARFRALVLLVVIAALVTAADLLFQTPWFPVPGEAALFVPLIVTNGMLVMQAEHVARHPNGWRALYDGLRHGTIFILLLTAVGALREWLAPFLPVLELPAGALFLLAALLGAHQAWLLRRQRP